VRRASASRVQAAGEANTLLTRVDEVTPTAITATRSSAVMNTVSGWLMTPTPTIAAV